MKKQSLILITLLFSVANSFAVEGKSNSTAKQQKKNNFAKKPPEMVYESPDKLFKKICAEYGDVHKVTFKHTKKQVKFISESIIKNGEPLLETEGDSICQRIEYKTKMKLKMKCGSEKTIKCYTNDILGIPDENNIVRDKDKLFYKIHASFVKQCEKNDCLSESTFTLRSAIKESPEVTPTGKVSDSDFLSHSDILGVAKKVGQ